ncbi:MAG: hypothetical protein JO154_01745 [Chitinophaga sp.]|uniref:hypothetical protein n=1 Tax=Chitinophaga sp. TaxID=1869181 RepID=UPI0025C672C4|nr:hypothetical protein [Chitinophaga sp.]MBV8251302.1 hypothetical protein [Chitinophaga sp.]
MAIASSGTLLREVESSTPRMFIATPGSIYCRFEGSFATAPVQDPQGPLAGCHERPWSGALIVRTSSTGIYLDDYLQGQHPIHALPGILPGQDSTGEIPPEGDWEISHGCTPFVSAEEASYMVKEIERNYSMPYSGYRAYIPLPSFLCWVASHSIIAIPYAETGPLALFPLSDTASQ